MKHMEIYKSIDECLHITTYMYVQCFIWIFKYITTSKAIKLSLSLYGGGVDLYILHMNTQLRSHTGLREQNISKWIFITCEMFIQVTKKILSISLK